MSTTQLQGSALASTAAPPAAPPAPAPAPAVGRFAFSGTGWGYYKIYMVNLLLTIATFGLYSPWAKVRNRRYLFGNALLDGHNFEFDAKPTTILLSRIVVVGVIVLASFAETLFGLIVAGLGIVSTLLLFLLPWVVVRGRAFNCRHTLHRSVRFRYLRLYRPTIWLYLGYLLVFMLMFAVPLSEVIQLEGHFGGEQDIDDLESDFVVLALYLGQAAALFSLPFLIYLRHRIQISQLCFGALECSFEARLGTYLRRFGIALCWGVLAGVALFLLIAVYILLLAGGAEHITSLFFAGDAEQISSLFLAGLFLLILSPSLLIVIVWMIYLALMLPVYWSSIRFSDGTRLRSTARASTYFWKIYVVNLLLIVASLGVLYPWAAVRRWRYIAAHTVVEFSASSERIRAQGDKDLTPLGEEYADVSGFDFDFGI